MKRWPVIVITLHTICIIKVMFSKVGLPATYITVSDQLHLANAIALHSIPRTDNCCVTLRLTVSELPTNNGR